MAYSPALRGPFLFDDLTLPPLNGSGQHWATYFHSVRPLYYISLHVDHALYDADTLPYHLTNLLLHLLNSLLLFRILKRILHLAGRESPGVPWAAVAATAVFLLHPLQTEAVSYISSRSEVLSVFFGFLSLLVFVNAKPAGTSWGRALLILFWMGLGLLVKEHIIALVAVFVILDLLFAQPKTRNWKLYILLLPGALVGGFLVLRIAGAQGTAGFSFKGAGPAEYLATQFHVIWRYLFKFAVPVGQNLDYALPFSRSALEMMPLLGLGGLLLVSGLLFRRRAEWPLAFAGWLVFLVLLSPTSSIIPIADAMAERRVYWPMIGLLLILLEWASRASLRALTGIAVVALLFGALTWNRNRLYDNPVAMWTNVVEANPVNGRAQFQLAHALFLEGRCHDSAQHYSRAASLLPEDRTIAIDRALALDCDQRSAEAIDILQREAQMAPGYQVYSTLGMLYGKKGQLEPALDALNRSIALNPGFEMAYVYRGNVYALMKKKAEAVEDFNRALALNPENTAAASGLKMAQQ